MFVVALFCEAVWERKLSTLIKPGQSFSFAGPFVVRSYFSINFSGNYFQPCIHRFPSCKSLHSIGIERLDMTASSEQKMTAPSSSNSIADTRKCFSLFVGLTGVHLLLSNFLGLILFTGTLQISERNLRSDRALAIALLPHLNLPRATSRRNTRRRRSTACQRSACCNRPATGEGRYRSWFVDRRCTVPPRT